MKCVAAVVGRLVKENANGTFDLVEGGIRDITALEFPTLLQLGAIFRFEFLESEVAGLHHVSTGISLDGNPLAPDQVVPVLLKKPEPGQPAFLNWLLNLVLQVPGPGLLRIVTTFDGFGGSASVEVVVKGS